MVLVGSTTVVTILIGSLCCQFWLAVLVGRPARHAGWQSLPRDFENAKMKDISDRMAHMLPYIHDVVGAKIRSRHAQFE